MIRATRLGRTAAIAAAAGCAALALASPAAAAKQSTVVSADCPQPYSQSCPVQRSVTATTQGPLFFQFDAFSAPTACAPALVHWFIDGNEWGSNRVDVGGNDGGYYADVSPGSHVLAVQLDGLEGGCNTGAMSGWGGTMHVETDADAKNGAS